uniref:Phosphatidylinositol-glycan biosynthesis class W protein n=1 Tax=Bactrocera latifrons TaxID=174628 RepID=A0A0K8W3T0_BACLA
MNITSIIEQWFGENYFDLKIKHGTDLLYNAVRVFYVIIPMICLTALAQFIGQQLADRAGASRIVRYVVEFVVIVIPTLLISLKFHEHSGLVAIICSVILVILLLITFVTKSPRRQYVTGSCRPFAYALNRAIVYVIAILGMGAPRFLKIPQYFEATYSYGIGFLDIDVGLYLFALATVKRTSVGRSPMTAAPSFFLPMLFLSFVRMLVILLNAENDKNPIRLHENYYFLFAVVVIIGSIICEYVTSQKRRIQLGLAILFVHEVILQIFTAEYILDTKIKRFYFIGALKEVYLSVPGFLALYLISVGIGDKMRTRVKRLSAEMFRNKLLTILEACLSFWLLTLLCIFTTSISRITCNTGYVAWILAVGCTMTLMHMLVFSFIFKALEYNDANNSVRELNVIPEFVTIINKNGILCYIAGYLVACSIKNFLEPLNRNENEAFCMLTVFMFIMALFSYLINNVTIIDL